MPKMGGRGQKMGVTQKPNVIAQPKSMRNEVIVPSNLRIYSRKADYGCFLSSTMPKMGGKGQKMGVTQRPNFIARPKLLEKSTL